jgi:APA family basic amino acid/polyamine antiporter
MKNQSPANVTAIKPQLSRVLGLTSGILMVAGIMIGSGIFKKIAPMAALGLSQHQILLAWLVAGFITLAGTLSVAGLASLTTESGGEYEYLRLIYGDLAAFMFGWACFTIIGSASIAAMGYIFAQSLESIFHYTQWLRLPGINDPNRLVQVVAVAAIVLTSLFNITGTKEGAKLNNLVTYAKIGGILLLIGLGFNASGVTELMPSTQTVTTLPENPGLSAFFAAMLSAFWAYDGWLNVAFISGEIKNPKRNVPIAMIVGVLLVMGLYLLVNVAFLQSIPAERLALLSDNQIAAAVLAESVLGKSGLLFIAVLIALSTFGALNGMIITYARLYYKMACDGLFFRQLSVVHKRFHTPAHSLWLSMTVSALLVFSGSFDQLTDMAIFAGFIYYILLAIGMMRLKQQGRISSGVYGYPVVPVLFMLCAGGLLLNTLYTQPRESLFGLLLIGSGLILFYGRRWRG